MAGFATPKKRKIKDVVASASEALEDAAISHADDNDNEHGEEQVLGPTPNGLKGRILGFSDALSSAHPHLSTITRRNGNASAQSTASTATQHKKDVPSPLKTPAFFKTHALEVLEEDARPRLLSP